MKKIKLEYWEVGCREGEPRWLVIQVIGSTQFNPGAFLTKAQVDDLCDLPGTWEVTIVRQKKD